MLIYTQGNKLRKELCNLFITRACVFERSVKHWRASVATCVNDVTAALSALPLILIPQQYGIFWILPGITTLSTPLLGQAGLPTELPPFWSRSGVLKQVKPSWARQQRTDIMKRTHNRGPAILQQKTNNRPTMKRVIWFAMGFLEFVLEVQTILVWPDFLFV